MMQKNTQQNFTLSAERKQPSTLLEERTLATSAYGTKQIFVGSRNVGMPTISASIQASGTRPISTIIGTKTDCRLRTAARHRSSACSGQNTFLP
jgi:hypothetical protein